MRSGSPTLLLPRLLLSSLLLAGLAAAIEILLSSQAHSSEATQISQSSCEAAAFDYSHRFGPDGNQGDQGQCYAFVAAGLASEHACASGQISCGESLSPIDISRDYPGRTHLSGVYESRDFFSLGVANRGGVEFSLLGAALDAGVCLEKDAPWFPSPRKGCRDPLTRPSCLLERLLETRQDYLDHEENWGPLLAHGSIQRQIDHVFERATLLQEIQDLLPQSKLRDDELRSILSDTATSSEFLQSVLIPPSCQKRRIRLQGHVWHESWGLLRKDSETETQTLPDGRVITHRTESGRHYQSLYPGEERFQRLTSWRSLTDRSIGVALCGANALDPTASAPDSPLDPEQCRPHGLIVTGLRWNPRKGQCELKVRNSWGQPTRLRGWVLAMPLLRATFRISGLSNP